jgi:hypothetical protein
MYSRRYIATLNRREPLTILLIQHGWLLLLAPFLCSLLAILEQAGLALAW